MTRVAAAYPGSHAASPFARIPSARLVRPLPHGRRHGAVYALRSGAKRRHAPTRSPGHPGSRESRERRLRVGLAAHAAQYGQHQYRRRQGHGGTLGRHRHRPLADQVQHRSGFRRRGLRRQDCLVAGWLRTVARRILRSRAGTGGECRVPRQARLLVSGPRGRRRSRSWTASPTTARSSTSCASSRRAAGRSSSGSTATRT